MSTLPTPRLEASFVAEALQPFVRFEPRKLRSRYSGEVGNF
jgi:hypothetical protein